MLIRVATSAEIPLAFEIRREVFVTEQRVDAAEEFDAGDAEALHLLAWNDAGEPVGTARLRFLPDGWAKLERIAVRQSGRGQGVGLGLTAKMLELARAKGYARFKLHAQTRAMGLYAKLGFAAVGEEFSEADIPHMKMELIDSAP